MFSVYRSSKSGNLSLMNDLNAPFPGSQNSDNLLDARLKSILGVEAFLKS
jgi:hypothetical protein